MGEEVVLFVDDSIYSSSSISQCRICHDEEIGSSKRLEAPCACSGTVKFAHRECVQRWCNEKGDTTCEICLQKFEPGYSAPPKKDQPADVELTISESWDLRNQLWRQEQELRNPGLMAIMAAGPEYSECSSASERSASCCRAVVLTFGVLLLLRQLAMLAGETNTDHHEFPFLSLLVLRAGGIFIPLYIITRIITTIQSIQRQHQEFNDASHLQVDEEDDNDEDNEDDGDDEDDELLNHTVHSQVHF